MYFFKILELWLTTLIWASKHVNKQRDMETSRFTGPISLLLKTGWKHRTHLRKYSHSATQKTWHYLSSCQTMTSRSHLGENVQFMIGRVLVKYYAPFNIFRDVIINHLPQPFLEDTSKKSNIVSILISTLNEYWKQLCTKCQ